jgi:large subunit ribosomal protein L1
MNIGKASFDVNKIEDNVIAAVKAIVAAKPGAAKGQYVKSCTLSSTMGLGVKLDTKETCFIGAI